jgi:hypothetical protein
MLVTLFASMVQHRMNAFAAGWQRLMKLARDPYRPELHYMRGPGPKCRAKKFREHGHF